MFTLCTDYAATVNRLALIVLAGMYLGVSVNSSAQLTVAPELVVQTGHTAVNLNAVAFSADGKWLATTGSDGRVKIWNVDSEREVRTLLGHMDPAYSLAFSRDGKLLVSGGSDKFIRVWDVVSGKELDRIPTETKAVLTVAVSPDGHWFAWGDGSKVTVWDRQSRRQKWSFTGHKRDVTTLNFSHNSKWLVSGGDDPAAHVWVLESGSELRPPLTHRGGIASVVFDPSDKKIATASDDGTAGIWSTDGGQAERYIATPASVRAVNFQPDRRLAAACIDPIDKTRTLRVIIWNYESGKEISRFNTDVTIPTFLYDFVGQWPIGFSADGKMLGFAPEFRTISIIDLQAQRTSHVLSAITTSVHAVSTDPGRRWLAAATGANIQLWNLLSGEQRLIITGYRRRILAMDFSLDAMRLTTVTEDGRIDVWDVAAGTSQTHLRGKPDFAYADGAWFATGNMNGTIKIWDGSSRKPEPVATTKIDIPLSGGDTRIALNADATMLATGSQLKNQVSLWEIKTGRHVQTIDQSGFNLGTELRFNRDGTKVAWGTFSGAARVLDVRLGTVVEFCCHTIRGVNSVAFSNDGDWLASAGQDQEIRVWDVTSNREAKATLSGHTGSVTAVRFSSDGKLLISGSEDGTTRIWDWQQKEDLADLIALDDRPGWLSVTPAGLFDGTADAIPYVNWRVPGTNDVYALDTFYNDYFHPGLPAEIFQGKRPRPCRDIAAVLRLPGVRTLHRQRLLHIEFHDGHSMLCLPDQPDRSLFDTVDVTSKGIPVTVRAESFHTLDSKTCTYGLDLPGVPNEIELNARTLYDSNQHCQVKEQPRDKNECCSESSRKYGTLHILTVAIGQYPSSSGYIKLPTPVTDAEKLATFFKEKPSSPSDSYKEVKVWCGLYDGNATRESIRRKFAEMSKDVKDEDIVLLFLSGHGRIVPGQEMFYFIPVDGKAGAELETGLNTAMLVDFIRMLHARQVVIMIDACQSGGALDSLSLIADLSIRLKAERTNNERLGKPASPVESGIHVVAAAIPFQDALISDDTDLFAAALFDGLNAGRGELKHDVSVDNLGTFISEQLRKTIKELSERQMSVSFSRGVDFILVGQ